ncbi:MAG TPA: stage III sporulation protein SpoIIIAB [Bacilli bacterium]|nr:stage III sporulation protein SpoIIIAB [Bacilli bacterium]
MSKLIGSVLIIAAATLLGFRIAARYADRTKQLRQFVTALKVLETEIHYAATPLPQALQRIGRLVPKPVAAFFQSAADKLRDGRGIRASEAWQEALLANKAHLALKEADCEVLLNFGQTLGVSDRQDQIKHIHLAIAHLSAEENNARDEQQRNEKMWKYLGALMGLTVVILLY